MIPPVLMFLFLGAAPAADLEATQAPAGGAVVLYDLVADKGEEPLAAKLTEALLVHLGQRPGMVVIGQSELSVLVGHEQDKDAVLQCTDREACLARIAEATQAGRLVTGRLGRVGGVWLVSLKLADAKEGLVTRGETASADHPEELAPAVLTAVDRLLGLTPGAARERFEMRIAPQGTKAAVVDLVAHDVPAALAQNLTQLLSLELRKFQGLGVISRDEIQTLLQFQADKQALECKDDVSCLAEIGGALGVDFLVTGSVGRLGESRVVNLKLMDVHEARVVTRVSESFQGDDSHLPVALRFAAWNLLGKVPQGSGTLALALDVGEGLVSVDGAKPRPLPLPGPIALPVGKHGVAVQSEGYRALFQEAYVEPSRRTDLHLALTEIPVPWYEKWWVWTAFGATVAAGVTTAVLLSLPDPSSGSVLVKVR